MPHYAGHDVAAASASGYNWEMQPAGFFSFSRGLRTIEVNRPYLKWACLFGLVIVAATIFAYRPAWNGGFIWDDDEYVTKNQLLVAPHGLQRIWLSLDSPSQYFPLTYTTFRIERRLWGLNPTGYHWVNILLHVANALLLWWLLSRLRIPGAWLAAGIFALHPVHVESVAWITERKNVLMGFFFLLTLLSWTEFIDQRTKQPRRFYALALIFYLLALFAKSTACTLPAVLFLILWLQKKRIDGRRTAQIAPFVLLGLAMGLVAIWWERYHQGTHGTLFALGPIERLIVATHAVWFYLGKLFWPANLTFIYPNWNIVPSDPLSYGWLAAGIALCVAIYFARRRLGRGVEVAATFFVATLSPVLGFIMLYTFRYTFVADHYQYLASIGPIALVSAGLVKLTESLRLGPRFLAGLGILIFSMLATLTWHQSKSYSDIETLWRTTLEKNPGCWMAENNLGDDLFRNGKIDEAIPHYEKSLQMHSDYPEAHYNYGNVLLLKGRVDEAIAEARQALALRPNDADEHVSLGNALLTKGLGDEAIEHYAKALELSPNHSSGHYNMGNALLLKNHLREGIGHYEKALAAQPDFFEALANLSWVLATAPDLAIRNGPRAIEFAERADRLAAGNPIILRTLGAAYAQEGEFDKAVKAAQDAEEIARQQNQTALADALRREIRLYENGSAYREP
ncbi:MAG: tetratricopeptide repeat protein [Verrucomicrobiota bacterium]